MPNALLLPMTAHVALTALLYAWLTLVRAPAVWGIGRNADGGNPWADFERRISANLSNQFEWPMFFHIACVLLIVLQAGSMALPFAWLFVVGRILHSGVQILTRNVRLRGLVFMVNFLAVFALWGLVLLRAYTPVEGP